MVYVDPGPRLSTGNEYISLPDISIARAGVQNVGFLHRDFRACVELRGSATEPFLRPLVLVNGQPLEAVGHELLSYWIPRFRFAGDEVTAKATIFAPKHRTGFAGLLSVTNNSTRPVTVKAGWRGCWNCTYHIANLSKLMAGTKHGSLTDSGTGVPVIEFRGHTPLFAVAFAPGYEADPRMWGDDGSCNSDEWASEPVSARPGMPIEFEIVRDRVMEPSETVELPMYVGVGLEEVSAVASARHLSLHGWDRLLAGLRTWLNKHTIDIGDEQLKHLMNVNSFYNYFYATGTALDSESLVVVSARSSRSDCCASYRDRDAMRWSMPAVLQISPSRARDMLIYAFTTQLGNVGAHSRFIDGLLLEPGFQLDHLVAPLRALHLYVQNTDDMSVLFDRRVQTGINTIRRILGVQRHPEVPLFETLLLPSGEPSRLPYDCYSNVLVWRSLLDLGWLYDRIRDIDRSVEAVDLAGAVKTAIWENFVVPGPFGEMFARSIDLHGEHEIGDHPSGSLQMLAFHQFCDYDDAIYRNTMQWIGSEHNREEPLTGRRGRPAAEQNAVSLLKLSNDLLTGAVDQTIPFLRNAALDDGLACEYLDPKTGAAVGGVAFASCAGYLALGLRVALNAALPETAMISRGERSAETLYEPPPEPSQDSKKARL